MPFGISSFSVLDKNIRKYPWPYYAWLQSDKQRRVYKLPDESNFYIIHAYDDVKQVLTDQEQFSSQIFPDIEIPFFPMMKGPEHQRIRSAVRALFSNKMIAALSEDIQSFSRQYADDLFRRKTCDIVDVWSSKIPLASIATIFGYADISNDSLSRLRQQATSLNIEAFPVGGTGLKDGVNRKINPLHYLRYSRLLPVLLKLIKTIGLSNFLQFNQYLKSGKQTAGVPRQQTSIEGSIDRAHDVLSFLHTIGEILEYRVNPDSSTVVSRFLQAHNEGKVSFIELLMGCLIILLAGYGTTSSLLSVGTYLFAADGDVLQTLKEDDENIDDFVEEMLRVYAPLQRTVRRVTASVELGGYKLPKDAQLIVLIGAANVDPEIFENPYTFDISRNTPNHITFGKGIHTCLGTVLARKIARLAFTEMVARLRKINIVDQKNLQYITDRDTGMYGFEKLLVSVQEE